MLNGAKSEAPPKLSGIALESLVWAIVSIFVVGLGIIIGLMAMMKDLLNLNTGIILGAGALIFLLMLAIEGVFIWLLFSRQRVPKEAGTAPRLKEQATKELDAAQARALPEPVPSVSEHTTRSFEPIYSERKSN